jgi:hypothetical protein
VDELGRSLADFAVTAAWRSGIVALAALAALPLLRRTSGRVRHAVLVAVLIACAVVPFVRVAKPPAFAIARVETTRVLDVGRASARPPQGRADARPTFSIVAAVYLLLSARAGIALMRALANASRLRRTATKRVTFTGAVTTPITVGLLRPAILLPATLPRQLLRPVLGHELAHVRRRDALLQLLVELLTLPVAFHPLVQRLKRHAATAREVACDEAVTAMHVAPRDYARALVAVATNAVPQAALAFGAAEALETRLLALRDPIPRRNLAAAAIVVAVVAAIAGGVSRFPLALFGSGRDDFNGRWLLDRDATRYGPIAPYQTFAQSLAWDGQRLKSSQTRVRDGKALRTHWAVRTDGVTRPVDVDGVRGESSARWDGDALLLELSTVDGHWEQTSAFLQDDDTLICEGKVRDRNAGGAFRFVFRRKGDL